MKNRIKELRKELNLTQEKFGEKLGMKKNSISQIENGVNAITDKFLVSICREFNVNENWLRTGEGDMFVELDRENQLMIWAGEILKDESDSFKRRFVKMLMDLNESDWETLEKIAVNLHKES